MHRKKSELYSFLEDCARVVEHGSWVIFMIQFKLQKWFCKSVFKRK